MTIHRPTGRPQTTVAGGQIEEFNNLHRQFVSGTIDEAAFRTAAVERFGYTDDELTWLARRLRKERVANWRGIPRW